MVRRSAPTGFTLLELLVCIAIIAILAAFTVSAAQRVRRSALEVERINWLRQRRLGVTGPRHVPIKILFIGNSYTSTNDLPGLLQRLAATGNTQPELIVESHLVGGARLIDHWNAGLAVQKIESDNWDFVVLQEQSQTPLPHFGRDQFFYPAARQFVEKIREQGAIPLFFMTWARPDTPGPQEWWTDSYLQIARSVEAECVAAGMAMESARQKLPARSMFTDPGGHPTPEASYLVACAFYAALFDRSPQGLPPLPSSLPASEAQILQQCAWTAHRTAQSRIRPRWWRFR